MEPRNENVFFHCPSTFSFHNFKVNKGMLYHLDDLCHHAMISTNMLSWYIIATYFFCVQCDLIKITFETNDKCHYPSSIAQFRHNSHPQCMFWLSRKLPFMLARIVLSGCCNYNLTSNVNHTLQKRFLFSNGNIKRQNIFVYSLGSNEIQWHFWFSKGYIKSSMKNVIEKLMWQILFS